MQTASASPLDGYNGGKPLRIKFCERGDVFICDHESGRIIRSPWEPEDAERSYVTQEGYVAVTANLSSAHKLVKQLFPRHEHLQTWLSQLTVAGRLYIEDLVEDFEYGRPPEDT